MENYNIRQIRGLAEVKKEDGADLCGPLLSYDEEVILSYKSTKDRVFFTSKRIVIICFEDQPAEKKEYFFVFYSRVSAFAIETNNNFGTDTSVKLWIPGLDTIILSFANGNESIQIAELIGSHTK
ncbi:MAG: PH domain-containing protein [Bacteroidales bacterium]